MYKHISIIFGMSLDEITISRIYFSLERPILNAKIMRQFEEIKGLEDRTMWDTRFNI